MQEALSHAPTLLLKLMCWKWARGHLLHACGCWHCSEQVRLKEKTGTPPLLRTSHSQRYTGRLHRQSLLLECSLNTSVGLSLCFILLLCFRLFCEPLEEWDVESMLGRDIKQRKTASGEWLVWFNTYLLSSSVLRNGIIVWDVGAVNSAFSLLSKILAVSGVEV